MISSALCFDSSRVSSFKNFDFELFEVERDSRQEVEYLNSEGIDIVTTFAPKAFISSTALSNSVLISLSAFLNSLGELQF